MVTYCLQKSTSTTIFFVVNPGLRSSSLGLQHSGHQNNPVYHPQWMRTQVVLEANTLYVQVKITESPMYTSFVTRTFSFIACLSCISLTNFFNWNISEWYISTVSLRNYLEAIFSSWRGDEVHGKHGWNTWSWLCQLLTDVAIMKLFVWLQTDNA